MKTDSKILSSIHSNPFWAISLVCLLLMLTFVNWDTWRNPEHQQIGVTKYYSNDEYGFQFYYPYDWEIESEETDSGRNHFRLRFTKPGFREEFPPFTGTLLSVSVTKGDFESAIGSLRFHLFNDQPQSEEHFQVSGRPALLRTGVHEFGGSLTGVAIENGDQAIILILRTTNELYVKQLQEILLGFVFRKE